MSRPGPLRYRRSWKRRSGPTGISLTEAQPSVAADARMRFFRQSCQTKRVTFCE